MPKHLPPGLAVSITLLLAVIPVGGVLHQIIGTRVQHVIQICRDPIGSKIF